jgi:hypothetical protein
MSDFLNYLMLAQSVSQSQWTLLNIGWTTYKLKALISFEYLVCQLSHRAFGDLRWVLGGKGWFIENILFRLTFCFLSVIMPFDQTLKDILILQPSWLKNLLAKVLSTITWLILKAFRWLENTASIYSFNRNKVYRLINISKDNLYYSIEKMKVGDHFPAFWRDDYYNSPKHLLTVQRSSSRCNQIGYRILKWTNTVVSKGAVLYGKSFQ